MAVSTVPLMIMMTTTAHRHGSSIPVSSLPVFVQVLIFSLLTCLLFYCGKLTFEGLREIVKYREWSVLTILLPCIIVTVLVGCVVVSGWMGLFF